MCQTAKALSAFYSGKKVFITGHTGFKGAWFCVFLQKLGADVTGYALPADAGGLFDVLRLEKHVRSLHGDVRDLQGLCEALRQSRAEIVFHLAAQPLVRESYKNPVLTYETNVMGTLYLLEALRCSETVRSFVNVTTDKVYENTEQSTGFVEGDRLDGWEPYANSKSCSELMTSSYRRSFFADGRMVLSTARAGNVIGGGDMAKDRILPDCVRSALLNKTILVRNPYSVRPYQHVLDPLLAYAVLAKKQCETPSLAGAYNIGPKEKDCLSTKELVELFCAFWGEGLTWQAKEPSACSVHEASLLYLNAKKAEEKLGYTPILSAKEAVRLTVEWTKCHRDGGDALHCMQEQMAHVLSL